MKRRVAWLLTAIWLWPALAGAATPLPLELPPPDLAPLIPLAAPPLDKPPVPLPEVSVPDPPRALPVLPAPPLAAAPRVQSARHGLRRGLGASRVRTGALPARRAGGGAGRPGRSRARRWRQGRDPGSAVLARRDAPAPRPLRARRAEPPPGRPGRSGRRAHRLRDLRARVGGPQAQRPRPGAGALRPAPAWGSRSGPRAVRDAWARRRALRAGPLRGRARGLAGAPQALDSAPAGDRGGLLARRHAGPGGRVQGGRGKSPALHRGGAASAH